MLSSNALIVGVIGILVGQAPDVVLRSLILGIGGTVGFYFALQWRAINERAWDALAFVQDRLKTYPFEAGENPMDAYDRWRSTRTGLGIGHQNRRFTRAAVTVFVVIYGTAILLAIAVLVTR